MTPKEKALNWFKVNDDGEIDCLTKMLNIALKEQAKQKHDSIQNILHLNTHKGAIELASAIQKELKKWVK